LQVYEPDWSTVKCENRELAIVTRRDILERCADTDILLVPAHFSGETAGHVVTQGDRFGFKFLGA
jgi:hypothetical protein